MKKTDAAEDSPKKEMKEIMKKSLISYIHQLSISINTFQHKVKRKMTIFLKKTENQKKI